VPGGSLSSSGARKLLPPSCPALYRWERDHPQPRRHFELGSAAHRMVLGLGAEWALLDYPDYRTKAAQQARDAARAAGAVPILGPEYEQIQAMAAAIRAHPFAGALFDPERGGNAEQSLFWEADGIWKRARLDWLPTPIGAQRLIVADYKTTASAEPGHIAKAVANFGYHVQAAFYLEGVRELAGDGAAFAFVFQEKTPPYLITVCELDTDALRAGQLLAEQAIEVYRDCKAADLWPGYATDIELISLPAWAARTREYA
jgi:hypothetical protein